MRFAIINNFQLDSIEQADHLDEDTLRNALSVRISEMLTYETDLLFSTLYRLDVLEYKIKQVMAGTTGEDIAMGLARLVIERQKEKLKTRSTNRRPPEFMDF